MHRQELGERLKTVCWLNGTFTLRSGQRSDGYFDKYLFESDPELLQGIVDLAAPLIPSTTQVLAGLELGGVAISTALCLVTGLPQVLVRKQRKSYGTAKSVEGPSVGGRRVLIIEDVITTGGQVIASAADLRNSGAEVDTVLCVLDRRTPTESGTDLLAAEGLSTLSLYRLDDLDPRG